MWIDYLISCIGALILFCLKVLFFFLFQRLFFLNMYHLMAFL